MRHDTQVSTDQMDEFDDIVDVRSPSEFALDHIPGAINCPVLDDAERARVGTLYKQVSQFDARKLGAALVAKNIALHLEQRFAAKDHRWKPLVSIKSLISCSQRRIFHSKDLLHLHIQQLCFPHHLQVQHQSLPLRQQLNPLVVILELISLLYFSSDFPFSYLLEWVHTHARSLKRSSHVD